MTKHSKLTKTLRQDLLAILAHTGTREQVNNLVSVCHTLAASFLASKSSSGTLCIASGLDISDLAYDCIADLFHQNDEGHYLQLQSYFCGLSLTSALDEEIFAHLRRLVFSKVNHGVYRLLSETDPSLAKILRNIKLAVGTLKNFTEIERFGELCLAPSLCDTLEHLTPFDPHELECSFLDATTGRELIPEMLAKLSLLLRGQEEHCRIVPLATIGLLIRTVYSRKHIGHEETTGSIDGSLTEHDVASIIKQACVEIQRQTVEKYVQDGKVTKDQFIKYFDVIEAGLLEKFLTDNGYSGSLYDELRKSIPTLSKDEYVKIHRNRLEYLLKLVEKKTRKRLEKM